MKRSVFFCKLPGGSDSKESACSDGDLGSIPGSGWEDSPGEGNGNPLQYSCLENSMDRRAWQATVHGVANSRDRTKRPTHMVHSVNQELTVSFLLFVF